MTSILSCQSSWSIAISRLSKVEREDKDGFRTCGRAESCQSNGLQRIDKLHVSTPLLAISCLRNVTQTAELLNSMHAVWMVMNVSMWQMKCPSSGASNTSWLKKRKRHWLSIGVSIWDRMSSKYLTLPWKYKEVRLGKTTQVSRGRCRLARWARDRGYQNPRSSNLSLGNMDRQGTIVSGEIYPERGIPQRKSWTRLVVVESSLPIDG